MTPPGLTPDPIEHPMTRIPDFSHIERPIQVCNLTFDEQRELPMRMQLGLDLTSFD